MIKSVRSLISILAVVCAMPFIAGVVSANEDLFFPSSKIVRWCRGLFGFGPDKPSQWIRPKHLKDDPRSAPILKLIEKITPDLENRMAREGCTMASRTCRGSAADLAFLMRKNGVEVQTFTGFGHTFAKIVGFYGPTDDLILDSNIRQKFVGYPQTVYRVPKVFVGSLQDLSEILALLPPDVAANALYDYEKCVPDNDLPWPTK